MVKVILLEFQFLGPLMSGSILEILGYIILILVTGMLISIPVKITACQLDLLRE